MLQNLIEINEMVFQLLLSAFDVLRTFYHSLWQLCGYCTRECKAHPSLEQVKY
jgi:hypothetical protein